MKSFVPAFREAYNHFSASDGWAMASHLALSLVFALFPFLIFTTALTALLVPETQTQALTDLVLGTWPNKVAVPIVQEINAVLDQPRPGLLTLAGALALFFSSNGVEAFRTALNRAYQTTETRSMILCRLQSLAFVLIGAVTLMIVSLLIVVLPNVPLPVGNPEWLGLEEVSSNAVARWLAATGALVVALFLAHFLLPAGHRPVSEIWPGIGLTVIAGLLGAAGFSVYIENFSHYGATYAGLSGIMTALFYLYLMSVIVIFGGELNAALYKHRRSR
ncbi:MAG: YihY/virulence factor BrkB family protein [Anderseniella sp.]|jgi:membrane protein|nr:YihY/virulence factor BrkB family protein [Anderseniella sp.]